jgi:hypothetical protein
MEIIRTYEEDDNFDFMKDDFREKIIPNLINEAHAHSQMEGLINDSRDVIGDKKADEILAILTSERFFAEMVR